MLDDSQETADTTELKHTRTHRDYGSMHRFKLDGVPALRAGNWHKAPAMFEIDACLQNENHFSPVKYQNRPNSQDYTANTRWTPCFVTMDILFYLALKNFIDILPVGWVGRLC